MTAIVLQQIIALLNNIRDEDYSKPLNCFNGSTIGQHVRHSIEIYQELLNGYDKNELNYDKRKRDIVIENSSTFAETCIKDLIKIVELSDKPLVLHGNNNSYQSSFKRELLYCDEHAIHHMALIKIGLSFLGNYTIDEHFGVAPSTIKYREQCVQ